MTRYLPAAASTLSVPPPRGGLRARIVLLADEGVGTNEIVHRVGCPSRP